MERATAADNYLRKVSDIQPILGMTAFDAALRQPGPGINRIYEIVKGSKQQDFPKDKGEILCKGAAVGLDEAGTCRHFSPGIKFLGFLEGQSESRAGVRIRGAVVLKIEDVMDESRGLPVFTTGPDNFSLKKAHGAEIGKIRFVQDGRASVAFRRDGDETPLDLNVK